MSDTVDARFLKALQQVLSETDAATTDAARRADDRAGQTGGPLDMQAAREHLAALAPDARDRALAQVHARMASDLSAIWDLMPYASGAQKPN